MSVTTRRQTIMSNSRRPVIRAALAGASLAVATLTAATVAVPAASAAPVPTNVRVWGDNSTGQLAQGHLLGHSSLPLSPQQLGQVKAVSGGGIYAMALLDNGTVVAWGNNQEGELGDGTTTQRDLPVAVKGLTNVVAISAGTETSLALLSNGTAMAWGDNLSGELGNGSTEPMSTVPVPVHGLTHLVAVIAGENFNFAIRDDGTVWAWGDNSAGELGIGSSVPSSDVPVQVKGLSGVKAVASGTEHALAVLSNGTVMSWGANVFGDLGTGLKFPNGSNVPVKVDLIRTAVGVAAGDEHSAALLADGRVMSWGSNGDGQLGIGTRNFLESDDPIAVAGLHTAKTICAGAANTLALRTDGTVVGWGSNDVGQLGNGKINPEVVSPVQAQNLAGVTSLSCGGAFGMAITG
jgi:alpha-tubulin suppressor-like RCC1 family protein